MIRKRIEREKFKSVGHEKSCESYQTVKVKITKAKCIMKLTNTS